jgi:protein-S-isoprenylcysteine O-methyltransferase Ste14
MSAVSSTSDVPIRQSWAMPPFYLLVAILLMIALDLWVPLGTLDGLLARAIGMLLGIAGLTLLVWCSRLFQIAQTTISTRLRPRS